MEPDLLHLCEQVVRRARKLGADEAEAFAQRSRESSVEVRDGEVESLNEATGKGLGLRVITGGRLGFASTSDLAPDAIDDFVRRAVALSRAAARDSGNRLPDARTLAKRNRAPDGLFDPAVEKLSTDWKIEAAKTLERSTRAADPRVVGISGVGVGDHVAESVIASSAGFADRHRGTYVYLYAAPLARAGDELQTSSWSDYKRRFEDLASPEEIGRIAAMRTVRLLGARKAKTQRVPVIFESPVAASLVGSLARAVDGEQVRTRSSFLSEKLGARIAPASISLIDDGLLPGGIATKPFDGEGVPTRRTALIEAGVLASFLYDSTTARRAKAASTGNASRSYSSLPHIGTHNLYLARGADSAQSLVRGVRNGLFVTSMLGSGFNVATGDFSRGASGLWIRDGELAEPVHEITVAGNLLDMLAAIDGVGDDLEFRGSTGAPTLRFAELTVSGS